MRSIYELIVWFSTAAGIVSGTEEDVIKTSHLNSSFVTLSIETILPDILQASCTLVIAEGGYNCGCEERVCLAAQGHNNNATSQTIDRKYISISANYRIDVTATITKPHLKQSTENISVYLPSIGVMSRPQTTNEVGPGDDIAVLRSIVFRPLPL
ncbi:hypothetical protein J6590_035707 [Homalodisca vitripennis]|nr:hypothetical protein J6590_035707 [Homalodisca vitripennis]